MRKTVKTLAQTLSRPMYVALEFYGTDHTHDAVAYPTTGTRVALIRRGLLTTGHHAWDHTLTVDGESVLRTGLTVAEAFDLAVSINTAFTIGTDGGPANLDATEAALTDAELAEKISRRVEFVNGAIEAVRADWSPAANAHALGMVQAHAWWLALYRAEVARRVALVVPVPAVPASSLTAASEALFRSLVDAAGDWSGTPEIDVTPAQKGNLTDLKRAGLLTTQMDRGVSFAYFTAKGAELAKVLGLDWESLYVA